ncbi:DNA-directed RNA polymerase subunit B [Candidatus Woesearchaeota archaeon]|jgi:DNA-directed RNA polymerase subunit B|nr:DNA-directed RNA polymerase subunit B [Candidatus Woesearchaeota archaeon]
MSEVYLNGKFVGDVENPEEFRIKIIEERRDNKLSQNINIMHNSSDNNIYIESGKGRIRRPLIIVKEGKSLLTETHIKQLSENKISFSDLVTQGVIEYIDAGEEENSLVSLTESDLTPEHNHLEIAPLDMLSLCTSLVPYGNFGPGARLSMGSKNQKQALGLYASNYAIRMDMDVNILHQPQVPLVQSLMHELSNYNKHPAGQNIIVAVIDYLGYNMDDAIVINKASIERGLGRTSYYRPVATEELRYSGGLMDEITIPDKETKGYKSEKDYKYLEDDGIIYPEANINAGDVVIGKTSPPRFLSSLDEYNLALSTRRESSMALKHGESGVVDLVLISENEEGNKTVQVRMRVQKIPEIGDKFTSRHGQKGVIGLILNESDVPFTTSGITPDLMFSPHGVPSRMTISHLIELIAGKVGALSGRYIDGTTFDSEPQEDIRKELLGLGFKEDGTETMINPKTGEQMQARIYIGSMYYLRLKHMVSNKMHSRALGPIQLLTRQPTEGRAKEGGLRLGEMEKDTFVAHGASLLLKERFDSDKTIVPICEQCGLTAIFDEYKNKHYCLVCGDTEISNIELSYAFKLILDEFKSLCIYPKLNLKTKY